MEDIKDYFYNIYGEDLGYFADGLDGAILGVDPSSSRVVYSQAKVIEELISQGMDREEAMEYYYFNIEGAYMGEKTPIWVDDLYLEG